MLPIGVMQRIHSARDDGSSRPGREERFAREEGIPGLREIPASVALCGA